MKLTYKNAGVVAFILYTAGIFITTFFLYKLPDNMIKGGVAIGKEEVEQIHALLTNVNIIIGVTLLAGLLAVIFLLLFNTDSQAEGQASTVSFTRSSEKKSQTDAQQAGVDELKGNDFNAFKAIAKQEADKEVVGTRILSALCEKFGASQAALYIRADKGNKRLLQLFASYAFILPESEILQFEFGEGLVGQAAKEGKSVNLKSVPDGYIRVFSGLGNSTPNYLLLIPIKEKDKVLGVAEIASFTAFSEQDQKWAEEVFSLLAPKLKAVASGKKIEEDKQ